MSSDTAKGVLFVAAQSWSPADAEALRHGVVRRKDACLAAGSALVRRELRTRRWQSPTAGVLVTHNGLLTDEQRQWSALAAAPQGSMLGGLTAARYDGLAGLTADRLTVVVPGNCGGIPRNVGAVPSDWNVSWRWSTKLGAADVNERAIPPRTRLARSLVDAASERVAPRRSRVIILAGVQQRLVATAALWDALSRRGRCRNRQLIVESIRDAEGGIQSLPELEFDAIRRSLHLPEPARQQVLRRRDGRYYLDTEWRRFGIRVEIHGIPHSYVQNWDNDLLRQNDVMISGAGLLIFSSHAIRHLDSVVGGQLLSLFRSRGWLN